jgi:hypothetical protein
VDRLRGPRVKTERAIKHVHELDARVAEFMDGGKTYATRSEREPHGKNKEGIEVGREIFYVVVKQDPLEDLATITGDILHNLRSALNLLYCQLVDANRKALSESDDFPISDSRKKFEARRTEIRSRVGKDAAKVLKTLEPYKGGNDALWRLHKLNIVDKHRLLVTVGVAVSRLDFNISTAPRPWMPDSKTPLGRFAFVPETRVVAFKDGEEIYWMPYPLGSTLTEGHDKPKFTFEIALNEPHVVEGESLIPVTYGLTGEVERVLQAFAPIL